MEWGWGNMSDTLDRLKALNSKLEEKLSQKKGKTPAKAQKPVTKKESSPKEALEKTEVSASEPVLLKGHQREKERNAPYASSSQKGDNEEFAGKVRRLTQILLHHLGINKGEEPVRAQNIERVAELYLRLDIEKKAPDIRDLFIYKAMNISGIGLKEEDFGEIREGKYVQVIAITYEPDKNGKKKAKNISLGYFGKAETLDLIKKNRVIEFVLRWRYEKAFQNLEHYRLLLEKVRPKESLF